MTVCLSSRVITAWQPELLINWQLLQLHSFMSHTHTLRFAWRSVEDSVSVSGEHMSGLCAMSQYIPLPSVQCAHCTVVRQHHRFIDFSPSLSRSPEASHQCHSIRVLTSNQLCGSDSSMTHSACQCSLSCSTFLLRSSL